MRRFWEREEREGGGRHCWCLDGIEDRYRIEIECRLYKSGSRGVPHYISSLLQENLANFLAWRMR